MAGIILGVSAPGGRHNPPVPSLGAAGRRGGCDIGFYTHSREGTRFCWIYSIQRRKGQIRFLPGLHEVSHYFNQLLWQVLNIATFGRWYFCSEKIPPLSREGYESSAFLLSLQSLSKNLTDSFDKKYGSRYDSMELPTYREIAVLVSARVQSLLDSLEQNLSELYAVRVQGLTLVAFQVLCCPVRGKPFWDQRFLFGDHVLLAPMPRGLTFVPFSNLSHFLYFTPKVQVKYPSSKIPTQNGGGTSTAPSPVHSNGEKTSVGDLQLHDNSVGSVLRVPLSPLLCPLARFFEGV